jgi:hypothetical protein
MFDLSAHAVYIFLLRPQDVCSRLVLTASFPRRSIYLSMFWCDTCYRSFRNKLACRRHMDDARHWPCETCQKKFSSSAGASNHMDARAHRSARPPVVRETSAPVSSAPSPEPAILAPGTRVCMHKFSVTLSGGAWQGSCDGSRFALTLCLDCNTACSTEIRSLTRPS